MYSRAFSFPPFCAALPVNPLTDLRWTLHFFLIVLFSVKECSGVIVSCFFLPSFQISSLFSFPLLFLYWVLRVPLFFSSAMSCMPPHPAWFFFLRPGFFLFFFSLYLPYHRKPHAAVFWVCAEITCLMAVHPLFPSFFDCRSFPFLALPIPPSMEK